MLRLLKFWPLFIACVRGDKFQKFVEMLHTVSNIYLKMSSENCSISDGNPPEVVLARSDFIAVAAALSVVCGLFVPMPRLLFDILWGCSLCASVALLLVSVSARTAVDLAGFSPLMVLAALGRMALYTATAKLIFENSVGGTLIETVGGPIASLGSIIAIIVPPVIAVVVLIAVFKAAKRISELSFSCIMDTIPVKRLEIETDLKAGIAEEREASQLKERCFQEEGFYLNMAGAAKILRCDAVIALMVILGIIGGRLVMAGAGGQMSEVFLHACAVSAAGASVLILSPLYVIASALSYLVEKSSKNLTSQESPDDWQCSETVEIVSEETGESEKVELLNPDFVRVSGRGRSDGESIVEFEPLGPSIVSERIEDYYDLTASRIAELKAEQMPVLFTGSVNVSVAVNTAIRLSHKKHSVLLIDADFNRSAVAEVFEIEAGRVVKGAVETCIDNLSIWNCGAVIGAESLQEDIGSAVTEFDRVIIYAPDLSDQGTYEMLVRSAGSAVLFASEVDEDGKVCDLLDNAGCEIVMTMPAIARD